MNSIDKNWVDTHVDSCGEVVIPEGVQVIKKGAFQGNDKIQKIIIPDSVVGIEPRAFADCSNLQEIKLSSNLQILGMNAFRNCTQLKSINIPSKVKTIYPGTFEANMNLESVTLNGELEYISSDSFNKCENLTQVNINGVKRIDYNAFMGKAGISKITIDGQEFTIGNNEQLFSIQRAGDRAAIVTQQKDNGCFSTMRINLEKRTSDIVRTNAYLTDEGKTYLAIQGLDKITLKTLENLRSRVNTKLYIFGGEKEITPDQYDEGLNFNLYSIEDLIEIKTRILELKKQIQIPDKNDPFREKKIYGQIVRVLSENMEYDYWEDETSRDRYEEKTGKNYDEYVKKNKGRDLNVAKLESRNLIGLIRGTAVCHGYAERIRNFAAEYGIEVSCIRGTIPVNGKNSAHEWNQVRLDGIWYDDDFTQYQKDLAQGNLNENTCRCFLMGAREDGIPQTQYVGYKTKLQLQKVGKIPSLSDKKFLLNYGRVQQQTKQ